MLKRHPDNFHALANMGNVQLNHHHDAAEAERAWRHALRVDPLSSATRMKLASLLQSAKSDNEAGAGWFCGGSRSMMMMMMMEMVHKHTSRQERRRGGGAGLRFGGIDR